jgi:hypothetical protein
MNIGASDKTAVYLVCFHSQEPESLVGCERQFLTVERAIKNQEWPYDNGDDPSFYVARKGGPLTWGVCRQDLRNSIAKGSIVVFFSFTPLTQGEVLYRLCAVETVADKLDHRAVHRDRRFSRFRGLYLNTLIAPEVGGWRYDETDRHLKQRHSDWLWRIADHRGITQEEFDAKYEGIYRSGRIRQVAVDSAKPLLADSYILFTAPPDRAYISPSPPEVAIAVKGRHEEWGNRRLQSLTVLTAAAFLKSGRDYLRVANSSGRNVHRQLRFDVPSDEVAEWRDALISALKAATNRQSRRKRAKKSLPGRAKC